MCDADQGSYDAMILLTGRYDWTDMVGHALGYAYTGQVCKS